MDRFFSKLDLRDIKIDPFKTSFPPDADDTPDDETTPVAEQQVDPIDEDITPEAVSPASTSDDAADEAAAPPAPLTPERRPHVPAWSSAAPTNGFVATATTVVETYYDDGAVITREQVTATGVVTERDEQLGEVLKVSARSRPSAVAGAIAGVVRESGRAEVQAIGAGATNQAVKAVAIARDYLRETGIEAVCLPAFIDVTIENEDRTAIRLVVEPR